MFLAPGQCCGSDTIFFGSGSCSCFGSQMIKKNILNLNVGFAFPSCKCVWLKIMSYDEILAFQGNRSIFVEKFYQFFRIVLLQIHFESGSGIVSPGSVSGSGSCSKFVSDPTGFGSVYGSATLLSGESWSFVIISLQCLLFSFLYKNMILSWLLGNFLTFLQCQLYSSHAGILYWVPVPLQPVENTYYLNLASTVYSLLLCYYFYSSSLPLEKCLVPTV